MSNETSELEEATDILCYLQNIKDKDDAYNFVRIWVHALNEGLRVLGEKQLDIRVIKGIIAETDSRFDEVNG